MLEEELVRALITIGFGALAGGLTNSVAIWMLFHPYEPPRLGRLKVGFLHGAVPKNQPRLAAAIGKTVGTRLLTHEDLRQTLAAQGFRSAFDQRLAAVLDQLLEIERGSLREMIPAAVMSDLEAVLDEAVDMGLTNLEAYLASERFEEAAGRRASDLVAAVEDEPIGAILTPARGTAVETAVEDWLQNAVETEDFRVAVEDYLDRAARRLLRHDRTFEEILPLGLVGAIEKAIASYLPIAAERLGRLLEDPKARAKFEATIHELLHRFLRDLRFHQRVVARLVMTEETVDKVLDTIETEGAERLSEILQDPAIQDAMARGVNEAIVDFLRRPISSVIGQPDDPSVLDARRTLSGWVVDMARDPATREFIVEKLHQGLDKAGARTWGELLARVPPERIAAWLVAAARAEPARKVYRTAAEGLVATVLDRPIGTPARWLPTDGPARIEAALADPLWEWLQTQVPDVVERIDVAGRVEEKVLRFPTARLEELVRTVTHRELKLIVRLGYILGAVIGTVLVVVDAALG